MKPIFSTQVVARIALWAFIFMVEPLLRYAIKNGHLIFGHDAIYITTAVLVFFFTFRFGESGLIADFRDLCFYDIIVQCIGYYSYKDGYSLDFYVALNYTVMILKFIRLLWPLKTSDGSTFLNWPVFGPFSYLLRKKGIEIFQVLPSGLSKQNASVYLVIFGVFAFHYITRQLGFNPPIEFWAMIGVAILLVYFKPFLNYLDKRELEFIENREKVAVLNVTKAKNAELHAKNLELELAKAEAEQARDEAELAKANEETISRALRTAAHDLRQSISLIGFAGDEMMKASSLRERDEALAAFYDVNNKVTQAIEQIMYYAKLTTRQAEPRVEAVDMCHALYSLCTQWRTVAFENGIDALITYPRRENITRYAACDPMLARHVLQNLLSNAIAHSEADRIILSVRNYSDYHLVVQVHDRGKGIEEGMGPDEYANFAAFARRIYDRDTQRGDGHGLGVNIVKQMCEVAHIAIGLRSRIGGGTVFTLYFPKASPELIAKTQNDVAVRAEAKKSAKLLRRAQSQEETSI